MPLNKQRVAAVHSFLRSFNSLLKSVRLYGLNHDRVKLMCDTAWHELRAALATSGPAGFVLGVSGSRLVLDGESIEVSLAERGFVELLSSNGFDSLQFLPEVTQEELLAFVRTCAAAGSKGSEAAQELRALFTGPGRSIRVNEVRFVASGPGGFDLSSLGSPSSPPAAPSGPVELPTPVDDPIKLLAMMLATGDSGTGLPSLQTGAAPLGSPPGPVEEEAAIRLVQVLVQFGESLRSGQPAMAARQAQAQLGGLPISAQQALGQTLASLDPLPAGEEANRPLLLRLAEQLTLRFALERLTRGKGQVVDGQKLLDRMREELDSLRNLLAFHEDKMKQAGLPVESSADVLDRQFWAGVPESGKRDVLLSPEAWCIPPRNVRQYVEQLVERGDAQLAEEILKNYASSVLGPELRARLKGVPGVGELADLYGRMSPPLFVATIGMVAAQMSRESESELQGPLSATFVKLAQEAVSRRNYPGVEQALTFAARLEQSRPEAFGNLRAALQIENKLQEFIDGSLRLSSLPPGIGAVLRFSPKAALEVLSSRVIKCSRRRERDRLVQLTQELGTEAAAVLREILCTAPPAKAAFAVGLLSRLEPGSLEGTLRARLPEWHRSYHDTVVRQIVAGGSPARGGLLVKLIDVLDPLLLADALEEIGLSGDHTAVPSLLALAKGEMPQSTSPYARLKAVEALGRLRELSAVALFTELAMAKRLGRWAHHRELRIVAAQSLRKVDPELAMEAIRDSGFTAAELNMAPLDPSEAWPGVRPRRYPRIRLPRPVVGTLSTPRVDYAVTVKVLSLGGGLLTGEQAVSAGTEGTMKLKLGLRSLTARVFLREPSSQGTSFSIADIDLDERLKLRSLLTE